MTFNETTNLSGVIQSCERYCQLGVAGISGDTNLLKEFTAHSNEALRRVWSKIFKYTGWIYEDSNQTNLPQASQNLTINVDKYALPSDVLLIDRIDVLDNAGNWYKLQQIELDQIPGGVGDFMDTPGTPRYYRAIGDTIQIFPAPNYTATNGFKVFFRRGSVAFASTDTTKSPGFASEYHNIVPMIASTEWLMVNKPNSAVSGSLEVKIQNKFQEMEDYYSKRSGDMKPKLQASYSCPE